MTLKNNILANYLGAGFAALSPLVALPWYLKALGAEQWGLVSFVILLQTIMGVLDVGLSQALVREFALKIDSKHSVNNEAAHLLYGLEIVYWSVAILIGLLVVVLANPIVEGWLTLEKNSASSGYITVYAAGALLVGYLPGSLYRSVLVGGQYQVQLNIIIIISVLMRHGIGVFVVITWQDLTLFIFWYVFSVFFETLFRGVIAWRKVGVRRKRCQWQYDEVKRVGLFALNMSGVVVLGALTVQVDKIIVSAMLPIEQFAYYSIASSVAIGMLQVFYPVMQAVLPYMVKLKNNYDALMKFNIKLTAWIVMLISLVVLIYLIVGEEVVKFWLQNAETSSIVYPILSLLLIGTALNSLYNIGYLNWVANARTNRILVVNLISFVLALIFTPIMVKIFGVTGAAFSWVVINFIGVVISVDWLIKRKLN